MLNEETGQNIPSPPKDISAYQYLFCEKAENKNYYQDCIETTVNTLLECLTERTSPYSGATTEEIKKKHQQNLLEDGHGHSFEEALKELKSLYLDDSILFHDRKYVAHLNCPIVIPALAAEIIISSVNTSMDTWDQSVGGTLIELQLIDWTISKIGYSRQADGIFTSGGTQSNLMGLLLARDAFIEKNFETDPKLDALPPEASKFKIFCSEAAHFSLKKNASLLGLGQRAIVPVPVNDQFQMDLEALKTSIETEIKYGNIPIAVVGTAGTTDFGSIDPLDGIAAIASDFDLWFHVDAAYGGGLLLSDKHIPKLNGIEKSHSATIDYHKTFFQPVSSSGFFMRDKKYINLIKYHADYLNPKDQEEEDTPNLVKKSIQTTRRFDALKLWMTLRIIGADQLGRYIDRVIDLAGETAELLAYNSKFEVLNSPELSAIVFRYNPYPHSSDCCRINTHIRKAMFQEGKSLIASTKVGGKVYLKFTLLNPMTTISDMMEIIEAIDQHGANYQREGYNIIQKIA